MSASVMWHLEGQIDRAVHVCHADGCVGLRIEDKSGNIWLSGMVEQLEQVIASLQVGLDQAKAEMLGKSEATREWKNSLAGLAAVRRGLEVGR